MTGRIIQPRCTTPGSWCSLDLLVSLATESLWLPFEPGATPANGDPFWNVPCSKNSETATPSSSRNSVGHSSAKQIVSGRMSQPWTSCCFLIGVPSWSLVSNPPDHLKSTAQRCLNFKVTTALVLSQQLQFLAKESRKRIFTSWTWAEVRMALQVDLEPSGCFTPGTKSSETQTPRKQYQISNINPCTELPPVFNIHLLFSGSPLESRSILLCCAIEVPSRIGAQRAQPAAHRSTNKQPQTKHRSRQSRQWPEFQLQWRPWRCKDENDVVVCLACNHFIRNLNKCHHPCEMYSGCSPSVSQLYRLSISSQHDQFIFHHTDWSMVLRWGFPYQTCLAMLLFCLYIVSIHSWSSWSIRDGLCTTAWLFRLFLQREFTRCCVLACISPKCLPQTCRILVDMQKLQRMLGCLDALEGVLELSL